MSDLEEDVPSGFEKSDEADASTSTELPVVTLGDAAAVTMEAPRHRLLPGRIHERWVLYPIYLLHLFGGLLAVRFALGTAEWSAVPVGLAWFLLYVWNWFYGVAYRYRRPLLKYASVLAVLSLTAVLSYFAFERADGQLAMVQTTELVERGAQPMLYWAGVSTLVAAGMLAAHLVFLGRGYRRKRNAA